MNHRAQLPLQPLPISGQYPNWFNASAVAVLVPKSNARVDRFSNRRERRASMKGAQR